MGRLAIRTKSVKFAQAVPTVITKARRMAILEKFFRLIFEASDGQDVQKAATNEEFREVWELELTKMEFAEALGMSPSSAFVKIVCTHHSTIKSSTSRSSLGNVKMCVVDVRYCGYGQERQNQLFGILHDACHF